MVRSKNIRSLFITLPQRDAPDRFPPYGALAVMSHLKKAGYGNIHFYHIDAIRPLRKDAVDHIASVHPDILCISAPVSTAYENCKYYSLEVKKRLPDTTIILGGNLAASAEIILRKAGVDVCVTGEGETPCRKLFDEISEGRSKNNWAQIPGLAYLDNGKLVNTGYAPQLPADQIMDVDWSFLNANDIKHCMPLFKTVWADSAPLRFTGKLPLMEEKLNTNISSLPLSKGCSARCTFCHRFQKGLRIVPIELCMARIKELVTKYNVGVFMFTDESFGTDNKRWLRQFCDTVKSFNLLWGVGGMRVDRVNPEIIAMMRDAGCRYIIYGIESGSERILQIMEKKVTVEQNSRVLRWTMDAGVYTIPQLVIGMPGETPETIQESAEFIAENITLDKCQNPREVSINFAQALPGTPLYEYARAKGMIGQSIEEEERYLLHIADRNAKDETTTLNFTDYSRLALLSWRNVILATMKYRYAKKFGMAHYNKIMFRGQKRPSFFSMLASQNFGVMLDSYPVLAYRIRRFLWLLKLVEITKKSGIGVAAKLLAEAIWVSLSKLFLKAKNKIQYKSLRQVVEKDIEGPFSGSKEMVLLRMGR